MHEFFQEPNFSISYCLELYFPRKALQFLFSIALLSLTFPEAFTCRWGTFSIISPMFVLIASYSGTSYTLAINVYTHGSSVVKFTLWLHGVHVPMQNSGTCNVKSA